MGVGVDWCHVFGGHCVSVAKRDEKTYGNKSLTTSIMLNSLLQLGYWRIRGLGAPIRYALQLRGVEYEEVIYEQVRFSLLHTMFSPHFPG